MQKVDLTLEEYKNPEDINSQPNLAPSKRLGNFFSYDKTADGILIFEMIGIEIIMEKYPRFSEWIKKIVQKLQE